MLLSICWLFCFLLALITSLSLVLRLFLVIFWALSLYLFFSVFCCCAIVFGDLIMPLGVVESNEFFLDSKCIVESLWTFVINLGYLFGRLKLLCCELWLMTRDDWDPSGETYSWGCFLLPMTNGCTATWLWSTTRSRLRGMVADCKAYALAALLLISLWYVIASGMWWWSVSRRRWLPEPLCDFISPSMLSLWFC